MTQADATATPAADAAAPAPSGKNAMRLEHLTKTYKGSTEPAVNNLSIDIKDGEFLTLLGPSGCGKTTTLRIVAGLETADAGKVFFDNKPIVDVDRRIMVRPNKRDLGMVFQAYAIWPHMTVEENVAFPLEARHVPKKEIRERVMEALALVGMQGFEKRPAPLLSGGQQQRVALARAVVIEPKLLLLDEPFSNLDAKLREQMRVETKLLQERLKVAVLFVTHDQAEALALSDRIAIMRQGVVQQIGTPRELYEEPATEFVRDFVGRTLLFKGVVHERDENGRLHIALDGASDSLVQGRVYSGQDVDVGATVSVGVRPEDIALLPITEAQASGAALFGTITAALYVGERVEYQVDVEGHGPMILHGTRHEPIERGTLVGLKMVGSNHSIWAR